jgi:hypothetical protein
MPLKLKGWHHNRRELIYIAVNIRQLWFHCEPKVQIAQEKISYFAKLRCKIKTEVRACHCATNRDRI